MATSAGLRCPRCTGRLFYEDQLIAHEWACLNCGYRRPATAAERLAIERRLSAVRDGDGLPGRGRHAITPPARPSTAAREPVAA
jgi:DNA-directed RNA polymerase subunit RPC12/RpoP